MRGNASDVPAPESVLEASAVEIEWVYMTLRSGKRKLSPTIAKEVAWGDPPSPVEEPPPELVGLQELFDDDEMEVEEVDDEDATVLALLRTPRRRSPMPRSTRATARPRSRRCDSR